MLLRSVIAFLVCLAVAACAGPASTPIAAPTFGPLPTFAPTVTLGPLPSVASSAPPGALDPCLLGTWLENRETSTVIVNGQPWQLVGGAGTSFTFLADGSEVADYRSSQPIEGPVGNELYLIFRGGVARYRTSSAASTLTFSNSDYGGYSVHGTLGGQPVVMSPPEGDPPPVRYACSSTTLTEDTNDFHVGLTRAG
jgi:hypothetical protein